MAVHSTAIKKAAKNKMNPGLKKLVPVTNGFLGKLNIINMKARSQMRFTGFTPGIPNICCGICEMWLIGKITTNKPINKLAMLFRKYI